MNLLTPMLAQTPGWLESDLAMYAIIGVVILLLAKGGGTGSSGKSGSRSGASKTVAVVIVGVLVLAFAANGVGPERAANAGEALDRVLPLDFLGGEDGEL